LLVLKHCFKGSLQLHNGKSPLVSGAQGEVGDFWLTASPRGPVLHSAPRSGAGSMCEQEVSQENPGAARNSAGHTKALLFLLSGQ